MEQTRDYETFEPSQIISPDCYPIPTEGHIGYVHIEKIDNNGPELKPCLFEVDVCEWEDVG